MTRIVKDYAVRRDEILDAAERLIYTSGYEDMVIQDILVQTQIAKGTFYHYFPSKQALLEAIIDRMLGKLDAVITPLINDHDLNALEKLQQFLRRSVRLEIRHRKLILALLRVWYTDENAIVREKVRTATIQRLAPAIVAIVHQGIAEGLLNAPYPDETSEVALNILIGMEDTIGRLMIAEHSSDEMMRRITATHAASMGALERILDVPHQSLSILDSDSFSDWIADL